MKKEILEIINITILIIILLIGVFTIISLQGNRTIQIYIGCAIAIMYTIWGITHHWIVGNLHRKVMIEYVLIGAIAIAMILISLIL